MSKWSDLIGAGAVDDRLRMVFPIFSSALWTAPGDGLAIVRCMGAGGGGAKGASATGGYSGAWGGKVARVRKGEQIAVIIGAGGAALSNNNSGSNVNFNGNAGGESSVTIAGATYTAPGGPGGAVAASGVTPDVPAGPALPEGWDFGAASARPGAVASGTTGGAGVDLFMKGGDATTSASVIGSGGGSTALASAGTTGAGFMPGGLDAAGRPYSITADACDASGGEWGVGLYGGSAVGGNGPGNGGAGGGGSTNTGAVYNAGAGGIGGGGGAAAPGAYNTSTKSGAGGNGYACIEFFMDAP